MLTDKRIEAMRKLVASYADVQAALDRAPARAGTQWYMDRERELAALRARIELLSR